MEVDSGIGGQEFKDEEDGVAVVAERNRRIDDHSSALAEKLLQGWTLLNEHCPQCITPLVRNRQKKLYCAACRQWILTEAEAQARALQHRVDKGDLAELNRNGSLEQLSASSSPGSVTTSPAHQSNGKNNGVSHIRLSMATLRAEDEKAQEGRNPKRFASSDSVHDSVPRVAVLDAKDNGNQHGPSRPGTTSGFQQASPPQAPPKPALVLQPIVNPVNDILVVRRTLTTLNEKLEGIRQLISNSHDVNELRQLFAILEECIHAIEVTRQLFKSLE